MVLTAGKGICWEDLSASEGGMGRQRREGEGFGSIDVGGNT